jgi:WD40 repeat protein
MTTFAGHSNSVNAIALSPDEKVLASGSSDNTVKLWSFPDGQLLHTLQDRKKVVADVVITHDGKWVAAGSYGGRAAVWTLDGERVVGIKAAKKNLSSVAVSPDSSVLATAGLGSDIHLWRLPSGDAAGVLMGHDTAAWSLRFIDGGRRLLSFGYEQAVRLWDTETCEQVRVLRPLAPGVRGLALSPDETIAALSLEGRVHLMSMDNWSLQEELEIGTKAVNGIAFSPNGRWLAIGAADRKIRIWELS